MTEYIFLPRLFIRTSSRPVESDYSEKNLFRIFGQEDFFTALVVSSPGLVASYQALKNGELKKEKDRKKTLYALTKYALRFSGRPTPFGLFAGMGTARWGDQNQFLRSSDYISFNRLDLGFLAELSDKLASHPDLAPYLILKPNTTLYRVAGEFRYFEFHLEDGRRKYRISALEADDVLIDILSKVNKGISRSELAGYLEKQGFSEEEVEGYLEELVASRILVHELEPNVTGPEFLIRIQETLERIGSETASDFTDAVLSSLENVSQALSAAENPGATSVNRVLAAAAAIPVKSSKTIHFDKFDKWETAIVNTRLQEDIFRMLLTLKTISPREKNQKLEQFKKRFSERFGEQEVPLLLALDNDAGIGFGGQSGVALPLTDSLYFEQEQNENVVFNGTEQKLLNWLISTDRHLSTPLELNLLFPPAEEKTLQFAPSLSIGFRLISEEQIFLENIGGQSGANLIGRFGDGDENVRDALKEIHEQEQRANPDVIFAEIAHLPDSHLGNVLRRPAFRPHEIVFLSAPGVDAENQIHLNDLLVSVDRSEIILRDQKRNVRVIPRLGSAFNYTMDTLPVFEFLCSLQNDGYTTGLGFSWGALTGFFDFLPRVIVRNVVISPAQWNWNEKILKEATTVEKLKKLLAEHKLPERFLLSVGDQELLAEKNNDWLLEVLLDELKGKTHAVFKEYLHTEENPVKDKNRKELAHQFVATLLRKEAVFKGIEPENLHENVRRTFSPGSAWMYFKIYGGYRSLDQVLIMLSHIFQDCLANGQILKWFFIRYEDTDPHLRVRLRLANEIDAGEMLSYMGGILDTLQTEMKVSGWSLHPYERELERYGFESIDATESFFCVDSRLVCEILSQTASENERWLSGLSAINFYLDAMGLGLENKKEFMEYMRDRFMEEFRGSTGLKPQIDKLYRDLRPNVFEYLTQDVKNVFPEEMKKLAKELLTEISEKTASLPHWHRIMGSLLHMHVNRLMSADQRKQELVMYDFLVKFYTTQQAVRKK